MRSGFKLGTFLSLCITAAMASCGSDESTPGPTGTCGNNVAEGNEACDGSDLKQQTCATLMMGTATGTLKCLPDCTTFDFSACGGGVGGAGGGMNP